MSDFETLAEIEEFIRDFETPRLPKSRWTHEAHLVAGLWYVARLPPEHALDVVRRRIRAHNEAVGTPNTDSGGYHETLTRLYLRGLQAHHRDHRHMPLLDSIAALRQSPLADKAWPLEFYSRDRLFSVAARREWVEPDLAPCP